MVTTTRVLVQVAATAGSPAAGTEAAQDRPHVPEQVRHTGKISENVVAVEPDDRQQLLKDL